MAGTKAAAANIRAAAAPARHGDPRLTVRPRRINRSIELMRGLHWARQLRVQPYMKRKASRAAPWIVALLLFGAGAVGAQAPRATLPLHAARLVVVSNERSHDLTLLDGATLLPVASIPVPGRARGVRISPDHKFILVALSDDRPQTPGPNDAIAEVDLETRQVVRRIPA